MPLMEVEVVDGNGRTSYRALRGVLNPDGSVTLTVAGAGGGGAPAAAASPQPRQNVAYAGGAGAIVARGALAGIPAAATALLFSLLIDAGAAADAFVYDSNGGNRIAFIPAGFVGPIQIEGPWPFTTLYADANVPACTVAVGY